MMASGSSFPAVLESQDMMKAIVWLTCTSTNREWLKLKKLNERTQRFLGSWAGDSVRIIGDYDEEELCWMTKQEFEDITLEILAIFYELFDEYVEKTVELLRNWPIALATIGQVAMLKNPPRCLVYELDKLYPGGWKAQCLKFKAEHSKTRR